VPLLVTISNKGSKSDTLVQVVSAYAERVVYRDGDGAVKSPLSITVPPGDVASLQALGGPHLELENLQADKTQASSYPVTFRFSGAGSVTVSVPVSSRAEPVVSTSPGTLTTGGAASSLGSAVRPSPGTPG
jgi:copper(I)-binding protein